jgi:putative N6-adenine-specific DNA methylase
LASDINGSVLRTAKQNAEKAGVGEYIAFQKLPAVEFKSKKKYGMIICNPPYGERIGEIKQVEQIAKELGEVYKQLDDWSIYVITAHDKFEACFGKKSDKNRKLYNGRLKCYYYQYIVPIKNKL